jgi:D-proline reductase (dithiol) PrdB
MNSFSKFKNRYIAMLSSRFPFLTKAMTHGFSSVESTGVPWAPPEKLLAESKVALVTTAGIHHKPQSPFDMGDPNGDPSFRTIDMSRPLIDLMITHDYYDHTDADRDINIVFPIQRLWALKREGRKGSGSRPKIEGRQRGHRPPYPRLRDLQSVGGADSKGDRTYRHHDDRDFHRSTTF